MASLKNAVALTHGSNMNNRLSKVVHWLTIGFISFALAFGVVLFPIPSFEIKANIDGIHITNTTSQPQVASIGLENTLAYAKLNKESSLIHKGLIYLRYDLYLLPTAPYYSVQHIQTVDTTSPEYLAGYRGKEGSYQIWYNSLPKVWQDNPFICVFVSVPSTATQNEIKALGNEVLNKSYAAWIDSGNARLSATYIRPILKSAIVSATVIDASKSLNVKLSALATIIADSGIETLNPSGATITVTIGGETQILAGAPIDVGAGATNRAAALIEAYTWVDLTNPANADGILDTVEAWFDTNATGVKIGTFSGSGTSYNDRDYETIGNVTAGSKQTFTGKSIDVITGDFIGCYYTTGTLDTDTSGYSGVYYVSGDKFGGGANNYTLRADDALSLYGTGETEGLDPPTNVAATDGTHTDKVVVTWTKSDGANAYKVLRDAVNASGTLGDVATFDDTGANAPTITAGSTVATDGSQTAHVALSLSGTSANNGTTYSYTVYASDDGGVTWTDASAADNGYRGVGALTYQWQRSASTGDSDYSNIDGATNSTYDDTGAPAGTITAGTITASDGTSNAHVVLTNAGSSTTNGAVRYYKCVLNATGATQQISTANDGYRGIGAITYQWSRSAGDSDDTFAIIGGGTTNPYNDTGAPAGIITPGTATASDGTSSAHVTLTLSGQSSAAGAGRYYYCTLSATGAADVDTPHDRGYRGIGALTYQWQRSAADSDDTFSNIAGGTTNPYNDTAAPSGTVIVTTELFRGFGIDWIILEGGTAIGTPAEGRYFLCVVSADGAADANSTHNRGYKAEAAITEYGFDYGLTTAYGSDWTDTDAITAGDSFVTTIRSLTAGTVYHYRAKVFTGAWVYGADLYVGTKGSPVVYEYYNTGYDGDSAAIYGSNYTAQQFTAQATSHTAIKIKLYIKRVGAPGTVIVELYHANVAHERTGLAIASGTFDGDIMSVAYYWLPFDLDEVSLTGGSEYAIVVSAPEGGAADYVMIGADAGGGLADAVGMHSVDGGSTWVSDTPTDYLFEIWGNSCISVISGLVYPSYITSGDLLFTLEYINIYPPYVDETTGEGVVEPELYFAVRLLDVDGVTVVASTPMMQWGNKPGAIYLNAAQAVSITPGGAYYLEIYGIFTGNPSASYQLVATDWNGSIGGWVIASAHDMESYYSTTFTVYSPVVSGTVLDEEGGVIFTAGIPYLMETHPELFQVMVISHEFTTPATQVTPLAGDWELQLGAGISGVFNSMGTMFGLDGQYIGASLLFLLYLGLVVSVGVKGGTPLIAVAIAFPIVGFGVWAFLVDFVIIGVIILILAALTLIGYWVTRT